MKDREIYVQHWSSLTGKPTSEIKVPESLVPRLCFQCGWSLAAPEGSTVDGMGNHTHCPNGMW